MSVGAFDPCDFSACFPSGVIHHFGLADRILDSASFNALPCYTSFPPPRVSVPSTSVLAKVCCLDFISTEFCPVNPHPFDSSNRIPASHRDGVIVNIRDGIHRDRHHRHGRHGSSIRYKDPRCWLEKVSVTPRHCCRSSYVDFRRSLLLTSLLHLFCL